MALSRPHLPKIPPKKNFTPSHSANSNILVQEWMVRDGEREAASGFDYPEEMGRYKPAMNTLNVLHMEF